MIRRKQHSLLKNINRQPFFITPALSLSIFKIETIHTDLDTIILTTNNKQHTHHSHIMDSIRYILTDNFPMTRKQMKQVKTEPQSLYLLESMIACYERDGYYTRNSSYKWMIDPQNNKNNYSVKNLKNAWNRALSKTEGARIPDFHTFFTLLV